MRGSAGSPLPAWTAWTEPWTIATWMQGRAGSFLPAWTAWTEPWTIATWMRGRAGSPLPAWTAWTEPWTIATWMQGRAGSPLPAANVFRRFSVNLGPMADREAPAPPRPGRDARRFSSASRPRVPPARRPTAATPPRFAAGIPAACRSGPAGSTPPTSIWDNQSGPPASSRR